MRWRETVLFSWPTDLLGAEEVVEPVGPVDLGRLLSHPLQTVSLSLLELLKLV